MNIPRTTRKANQNHEKEKKRKIKRKKTVARGEREL
jgi:hypothetical protein